MRDSLLHAAAQTGHLGRGCRHDIGHVHYARIAPEGFQVVKSARILIEQMNHDVSVIENNPTALFVASNAQFSFIERAFIIRSISVLIADNCRRLDPVTIRK